MSHLLRHRNAQQLAQRLQAAAEDLHRGQADGPPLRVRLLAWVAVFAHLVLLEGTGGQTLGKRLAGIRVVDDKTGGPIGWSVATHRAGARALFWFVAFLALADPRWQTLHDRSAGTIVVKERRPAPPEGSPERMEFETTDDA
jgi:uncharacterized RDD family membrane protein YckC